MSTDEDPQRLRLDYRLAAGVAVVMVTGEVDVATCHLLREGLLRIVTDEHDRGLVVNLAGVTFMDSTGLGVLVGVWHRLSARRGCLALVAPSDQIRRVLATTGLTKVLPVYDLEADAVKACRPPGGGQSRPGVRPLPPGTPKEGHGGTGTDGPADPGASPSQGAARAGLV